MGTSDRENNLGVSPPVTIMLDPATIDDQMLVTSKHADLFKQFCAFVEFKQFKEHQQSPKLQSNTNSFLKARNLIKETTSIKGNQDKSFHKVLELPGSKIVNLLPMDEEVVHLKRTHTQGVFSTQASSSKRCNSSDHGEVASSHDAARPSNSLGRRHKRKRHGRKSRRQSHLITYPVKGMRRVRSQSESSGRRNTSRRTKNASIICHEQGYGEPKSPASRTIQKLHVDTQTNVQTVLTQSKVKSIDQVTGTDTDTDKFLQEWNLQRYAHKFKGTRYGNLNWILQVCTTNVKPVNVYSPKVSKLTHIPPPIAEKQMIREIDCDRVKRLARHVGISSSHAFDRLYAGVEALWRRRREKELMKHEVHFQVNQNWNTPTQMSILTPRISPGNSQISPWASSVITKYNNPIGSNDEFYFVCVYGGDAYTTMLLTRKTIPLQFMVPCNTIRHAKDFYKLLVKRFFQHQSKIAGPKILPHMLLSVEVVQNPIIFEELDNLHESMLLWTKLCSTSQLTRLINIAKKHVEEESSLQKSSLMRTRSSRRLCSMPLSSRSTSSLPFINHSGGVYAPTPRSARVPFPTKAELGSDATVRAFSHNGERSTPRAVVSTASSSPILRTGSLFASSTRLEQSLDSKMPKVDPHASFLSRRVVEMTGRRQQNSGVPGQSGLQLKNVNNKITGAVVLTLLRVRVLQNIVHPVHSSDSSTDEPAYDTRHNNRGEIAIQFDNRISSQDNGKTQTSSGEDNNNNDDQANKFLKNAPIKDQRTPTNVINLCKDSREDTAYEGENSMSDHVLDFQPVDQALQKFKESYTMTIFRKKSSIAGVFWLSLMIFMLSFITAMLQALASRYWLLMEDQSIGLAIMFAVFALLHGFPSIYASLYPWADIFAIGLKEDIFAALASGSGEERAHWIEMQKIDSLNSNTGGVGYDGDNNNDIDFQNRNACNDHGSPNKILYQQQKHTKDHIHGSKISFLRKKCCGCCLVPLAITWISNIILMLSIPMAICAAFEVDLQRKIFVDYLQRNYLVAVSVAFFSVTTTVVPVVLYGNFTWTNKSSNTAYVLPLHREKVVPAQKVIHPGALSDHHSYKLSRVWLFLIVGSIVALLVIKLDAQVTTGITHLPLVPFATPAYFFEVDWLSWSNSTGSIFTTTVSSSGWIILIYLFITIWVVIVDSIATQKYFYNKSVRVATSSSLSPPISQTSTIPSMPRNWPGECAHLVLFVYLSSGGGLMQDILGPLQIAFTTSHTSAFVSFSILVSVLLLVCLVLQCVLRRSALGIGSQVAEQAQVQSRQNDWKHLYLQSDDNTKFEQTTCSKHNAEISTSVGNTGILKVVDFKTNFCVQFQSPQHIFRDAILPCSLCSFTKSRLIRHIIDFKSQSLSPLVIKLSILLPGTSVGMFWFFLLSDLLIGLHISMSRTLHFNDWSFWLCMIIAILFMVLRDTRFFGIPGNIIPSLSRNFSTTPDVIADFRDFTQSTQAENTKRIISPSSDGKPTNVDNGNTFSPTRIFHPLITRNMRPMLTRYEEASLRLLSCMISFIVIVSVIVVEFIPLVSDGYSNMTSSLAGEIASTFFELPPNGIGMYSYWSIPYNSTWDPAITNSSALSCVNNETAHYLHTSLVFLGASSADFFSCIGRIALITFVQVISAVVQLVLARMAIGVQQDPSTSRTVSLSDGSFYLQLFWQR